MFVKIRELKSNKAFTLIESLIVIAIVGILVVSAVPILKNFLYRIRLAAASRFVASALRLARRYSVNYSKDAMVEIYTFDSTGSSTWDGFQTQNYIRLLLRTSISDAVNNWEQRSEGCGYMPEGIYLVCWSDRNDLSVIEHGADSPISITFRSRGSVTNAGAILVTYDDPPDLPPSVGDEKYHTVEVGNMNGRVRIVYHAEGWHN